jgi:hypothetical protein
MKRQFQKRSALKLASRIIPLKRRRERGDADVHEEYVEEPMTQAYAGQAPSTKIAL